MNDKAKYSQDWRIRFAGTISVTALPAGLKEVLTKRPLPGPAAKLVLFEIEDMQHEKEKSYFLFSGVGIGMGLTMGSGSIGNWTEFRTDSPIELSDFGGPTQFHRVGATGYSLISEIVFNDKVKIQGRGFWETLFYGDSGLNLPGGIFWYRI